MGKLPSVFLHISAKVDTFAEQLQANTQRYQSVFCAYIMYVRVGASRARGFQKIREPSIYTNVVIQPASWNEWFTTYLPMRVVPVRSKPMAATSVG